VSLICDFRPVPRRPQRLEPVADVVLDMAVHVDARAAAIGAEVDLYVARQYRGELLYALTMDLSSTETRVLGCLLEKQRTTPDAYPLSLNALRLACNQSTNRDPVVEYDDAIIRDALHRLERRGYTRLASGAGSRAAKYRHLLADALPMSTDEQAVICVLMLRGPQTPGELKQRTERMHAFVDLGEIHDTLARLIERELVVRLERRPGHKEERYTQLLQEQNDEESLAYESAADGPPRAAWSEPRGRPLSDGALAAPRPGDASGQRELDALRERVSQLERDVALLREQIRHPASETQP
jgi:uncharacterized protein YceH (UPF0502 family)